jgi:adenylate kinase family enzyme
MIFGPSASGKSTVANALGERLNIPVHHLDHFCFLPNTSWRKRPWEEFQKLHRQVVESDEWIIDGNYPSMMQCRMARATAVVWLNPSAVACIFNFYKRFFRKHRSQTPYAGMLEGANEKFTLNGVRYILKHKGKKSFFLKLIESFPHVKVFYLNSFKKIENFPRQISTEP